MLRVLVVSAVLGLVPTGAVQRSLPDTYFQKFQVVLDAKDLLTKSLPVDGDYNLFKPLVHYSSLLGVTYYTAKELKSSNQTAELLYEDSLRQHLADFHLNPEETVEELKEFMDKTLKELKPFSDLLDKVCADLSGFECNTLIDKLVKMGVYPEVEKSTVVLRNAYPLANLALSEDKRLKEVAAGLDVIPYLVSNKLDIIEIVNLLVKLLQQVS